MAKQKEIIAAERAEAERIEAEQKRLQGIRKRLGENLVKIGYRPPDKDFVKNHAEERPDFEIWDYSHVAEGLVICTCQPTLEKFKAAVALPSQAEKVVALAEAAIIYPEFRILDTVILSRPGLLWMIGSFILASSGFLGGGKRIAPDDFLQTS